MRKWIGWVFAGLLGCVPVAASAQQNLYTVQPCSSMQEMANIMRVFEEDSLFTGTATQSHISGYEFESYVLFQVNQDTGTWSLIQFFEDGTTCLLVRGNNFEPYLE